MKYYYGNDYNEAISNPPVEIGSASKLRRYEENYNVVIPVTEVADLVLDECDYEETDEGISVDKFIFDDYQKGAYLDILFLDNNDEGDVRSYKMVGEDDEKIYFEYIG